MVSFIFWLCLIILEPVRPRLSASYSVLYTTHRLSVRMFSRNYYETTARFETGDVN